MTDVTPFLTRKNLSRSSSATRAQQQPLQRREATHTLPMVNTPSPPDYTVLTVQPKVGLHTQPQSQQQQQQQMQIQMQIPQSSRPIKSEEKDARKQEQTQPQQPPHQTQQPQQAQQQGGFRRGNSQQNSNIYSPGVDYGLQDKNEGNNIKKKSGTAKGHYNSLPNSKLMQIPLFRPRGEQNQGSSSSQAPTQGQGQGQDRQQYGTVPFEKQALIKQSTRDTYPLPLSTTSNTSATSNIFESINPFKGFNPFGLNQQQNVTNANPPVNRIPPTITNSPNAAKSPKVELIHSRPTRPIAGAGFFSSPSSSFGLLSSISGGGGGGGGGRSGRSSDALSDVAGQGDPHNGRQRVLRASSNNAFNWFSSGENSSEYGAMSAPRSEDDLTFMVRASVTRPTTVPKNPTSPSLSHNDFT